MELKKLPRSCLIEGGWRLATVEQAQNNLESIKHLLGKWDRARLLDGWIGGSSYDFHVEVGFRSCVGYMLLVKFTLPDEKVKNRYSGVTLSEEGMRAALFLCTEDWNYDVVCWLVQCWSKGKIEEVIPWESVQSYELVEASKQVGALAIELQFVHSMTQISASIEDASRSRLSATTMTELVSNFLKFVTDRCDNNSLTEVLESIIPKEIAGKYWNQMLWIDDTEMFQNFGFNTKAEGTLQVIADTLCHVIIDAMAVRLVREWVIKGHFAGLINIVPYANQLLNRIFFEDGLGRILQEAAESAKGDLELFKEILRDQGYGTFSSYGRYSFLNTILVEAAKEGDLSMVETLVEWGVEPLETDDKKRETALHYAAKLDEEEVGYKMVIKLLGGETREKLAKVPDYKQRTPLHRAASCGHLRICNLLLQHKADVSTKDKKGRIPLHSALRREQKNEDIIRVLLSASSSVEEKDVKGQTPLEYAVEYQGNNVSMMTWLLPYFREPAYFKNLDLALYLREASRRGHLELVSTLLQSGAIPFDTDREGKTALHCAAEGNNDQKSLDIIQRLLLDEFKQVNNEELATACDKRGRNVLHFAASSGHKKLCEWLLSLDVIDVDSKDYDGQSALYYAVRCENDEAQLLDAWRRRRSSRQAINISDLKDFSDRTPLHEAAAKGNLRMVEKILSQVKPEDRKRVVSAADVFGQTALHKAACGGHTRVVKKLLGDGAYPLSQRDCDGKTALHYVVQARNVVYAKEIAEWVLKYCPSPNEKCLLLNAFAVGTGFAEESEAINPELQKYLLDEKSKLSGTTEGENSLRVEAILGDAQMEEELRGKGINMDHIRSYKFRDPTPPKVSQNVPKVEDQIDSTDSSVQQETDEPTLEDNLGRTAFVNGLASLFLNPSVSSPITVGISGEWGMGKSSVMLQVESILLKSAAHLTVLGALTKEDFPGRSNSKAFGSGGQKNIGKAKKLVKGLFYKATNLVKSLWGIGENNIKKGHEKVLRKIFKYQPEYHEALKSLAVAERRDMIEAAGKMDEEIPKDRRKIEGIIPAILTVRYNAWQYRSQTEAWAGLGVEIIKELEAAMTVAQRLSSGWTYNWTFRKRAICIEVLLPCFLAVITAFSVSVILYFALDRAKDKHLNDFKYGSLPLTLIPLSWAAVTSIMAVVKPISSNVVDYLSFPDHSQKLGYQQRVINDINFLKKKLGQRSSLFWNMFSLIWRSTIFCSWNNNIPETTIPKMNPASHNNLRMVVFVDDLDRCQDKVILEILSAINLVLSVCKINVVMAMEKSMIEKAVARMYGEKKRKSNKSDQNMADRYLRKIIQLPLDLPDPSQTDFYSFLQRQLGVHAVKKAAGDMNKEIAKSNLTGRKATFISRDSGRGKDFAGGGIYSHLPLQKEEEDTIDDSGTSWPQDSHRLLIPKVNDYEEPLKREQQKTDTHGYQSWVQRLKSFMSYEQQEITENVENWDIFPTIQFELLKHKYSPAESEAFGFHSTKVTGSRKLPREWKRMQNYHRVAWNVLSKSTQVKTLQGWQVQLITWVFICWQWKKRINTLIEEWRELNVFEEDDPWLRDIVEHYIDDRVSSLSHKIGSLAHGDAKDTINSRMKQIEDKSRGTMSKADDTGREDYQKEARNVTKDLKQQYDPLKASTSKSTTEKDEEGSLEEGRRNEEEQQQKHKALLRNTVKAKLEKEEKEQKEWSDLRETLKRYNVSVKSVIAFQDFRFYCVPKNLV